MKRFSLVYILFGFSGFSALIYELLFTYYLKLFLGHSAYSQALVLCVFMGGLTLGSALIGYFIEKIKNPALIYFWVEMFIGIYAIFFDSIFKFFIIFSQNSVINIIENLFLIDLYRIVSSSLLLLPQVILMGTTFPLISSFLLRFEYVKSGKVLCYLYFINTIGGALGIFLSGFLLLDYLGISETIYLAGIVNILVAIAFRVIALKENLINDNYNKENGFFLLNNITYESYYLFLFLAFLTGLSSFIYEISWIRMLSLVFGNSVHSFEIMLFTFLLGLACGGFYIRDKIDSLKNEIIYLANVQILMGFFAVLTIPLYNFSFDIFSYFFDLFPKNMMGYHLYNVVTQTISIIIMFPATFFAGMTLPLITNHLVKNGGGERAIGYVYAFNTIGAIVGIIITINVLFPVVGLKDSLIVGAVIDILIGFELLVKNNVHNSGAYNKKIVLVPLSLLIITLGYFFDPHPMKLVSGVYRTGEMINKEKSEILYYKEGKTASISVVKIDNAISIRTNGKSDGAISIDNTYPPELDEYTIFLLGYLPLLYHPNAKSAVNIGLGTGVTSNILLSNKNIKEVYSIEIEKEVVKAGKFFGSYNDLVYRDKRSKIIIDDARNFFIRNKKKFDIIVSEPSNPWISGVASLFTKEFYEIVSRDLNDDGVFVQWLQLYELDLKLLSSVFNALDFYFNDYIVYAPHNNELIIVAQKKNYLKIPNSLFETKEIKSFFKKLGLNTLADIEIRKVGTKKSLKKFFSSFNNVPNSDFRPILERKAPEMRFMNVGAGDFFDIANYYIPILNFLDERIAYNGEISYQQTLYFSKAKNAYEANQIKNYLLGYDKKINLPDEIIKDLIKIKTFLKDHKAIPDYNEQLNLIFGLGIKLIPYVEGRELIKIFNIIKKTKTYFFLDDFQRDWIELFLALVKRDKTEGEKSIYKLLKKFDQMPVIAKEYLFISSFVLNVDELKPFFQKKFTHKKTLYRFVFSNW